MGIPTDQRLVEREKKRGLRDYSLSILVVIPVAVAKNNVTYCIKSSWFTMDRCFFFVFWFILSQCLVRYVHAQKKREIVVSCIGDSLTYGLGASKLHTLTYPSLLQTHLQTQFPTVQWTIHNFGDNGKTALKGTGRHSYWNTETYKKSLAVQPNIVIIQLGMHELFSWYLYWPYHQLSSVRSD